MIGIQPFKKHIAKYAPSLLEAGYSLIDENDYDVKFTDGEVFITFHVERYSEDLEVWIEYLSDSAQDKKYRLDIIMQVYLKKDLTNLFRVKTEAERENLVQIYIEFIVRHKVELFGADLPLDAEYEEFQQRKARQFFEDLENLSS